MGEQFDKVRRRSKVDTDLPKEVREEVDRLLIENATYEEISGYLKAKGHDISKSSIGRYGKNFLNLYRDIRILEDKSKAITSESGEGMSLEEATSKLFTKQILELLFSGGIDLSEKSKLIGEFAKLQSSSVARERLKADIKKKAEEAAESVVETVRKGGLSEEKANEIKRKILGIAS